MIILWLASAESDLDALTDYITEDSPQNALQVFTTLRNAVEKIASYPEAGRAGRINKTRELVIPHLPCIIVYKITKEIQILAIVHTSRKWPTTFEIL